MLSEVAWQAPYGTSQKMWSKGTNQEQQAGSSGRA